jgi:uncharacterized repeat protein (TIGR01451 family)
MKKTYFLAIILMAIFSFVAPAKSFADTSCQPIYGGGQTCVTSGNVSLNKMVLNPQTNQFVDNLNINDPRYQPGFITTFQISVTNTGNSKISKISVKDVFPQYLTYSSGPGNFDSNSKTLSFEVDNLSANETRKFTVIGKVVDANQIPIDQGGVVCVVNQSTATNLDNNSQAASDNAQFCIEKIAAGKGFPVVSTTTPITVTPSTGPESQHLLFITIGGIIGLILRKHSLNKRVNN